MLSLFTALNFLNYMDRYLLAALLPVVSKDFGLSNEEGGTLISAFVVGYVICSPIIGFVGDRFPRPKLMALGVVIWSLATACSGLAVGFHQMFLARVVVGIGEGSFATLAPAFLRDRNTDPVKLNSQMAIFFVAIPVGSALGYALAGGISSILSWHYVFFIGALPGLCLSGFLLRYTDERVAPQRGPQLLPALREIGNVSHLRYAIGGYIFQAFALNGVAAFITKLGVERGFSLESISTIFGLILVGTGLFGTYLGGRISTRLAAQSGEPIRTFFRFLGYTSLAGVPFLALAFLFSNPIPFLVCAGLAELMIFAGTAPINSIIVLAAPKGLSGLTQGLTITSLNLFGALVGPIVIGRVADHSSLSTGLQLTTVALGIAGVLWALGQFLPETQDRNTAEVESLG